MYRQGRRGEPLGSGHSNQASTEQADALISVIINLTGVPSLFAVTRISDKYENIRQTDQLLWYPGQLLVQSNSCVGVAVKV